MYRGGDNQFSIVAVSVSRYAGTCYICGPLEGIKLFISYRETITNKQNHSYVYSAITNNRCEGQDFARS